MLGLALVCVVACIEQLNSSPGFPAEDCGTDVCVIDPVGRCVPTSSECGGAICPLAAQCVTFPANQCFDAATVTACGISPQSSDVNALTEGFRVSPFNLRRQPAAADGGPAAFTWDPIPNAKIVRCAVFICDPIVVRDGGTTEAPVSQIQNYAQCAVQEALFSPGQGTFDLGQLKPPEGYAVVKLGSSCIPLATRYTVTDLSAGCWAYDTSQVIAATPLVSLLPGDVATRLVDQACTAGQAGSCLLPDGVWGTCYLGECGRRCVSDHDCRSSEAFLYGPDATLERLVCGPGGSCVGQEFDGGIGVCHYPPIADAGGDAPTEGSTGGPIAAGEPDAEQ
jgi:hypothetical protein